LRAANAATTAKGTGRLTNQECTYCAGRVASLYTLIDKSCATLAGPTRRGENISSTNPTTVSDTAKVAALTQLKRGNMIQTILAIGLGTPELIAIVAVVFLLFGATRLPQLAKSLGQSKRAFKEGLDEGEKDAEKEAKEK